MILWAVIKGCHPTDTIDYFRCALPDGREILIDWSESSYHYEKGNLKARLKEVFFTDSESQKEEYADGKLKIIKDATLDMFECSLNENDNVDDSMDIDNLKIVCLEFDGHIINGTKEYLYISQDKRNSFQGK